MFDGPSEMPDSTTGAQHERLADLERRKTQDAMNGLIDTDVNEEDTSPGSDDDKNSSDTSSEDIYGAD
ncbi:hypothetical protein E4U31_008041 [Claviceps sp. LM219 group G6]|nr:hypothetical protein E4U31_008041 [Claviceps sp. LM219 group G6]